MYVYIYIYVNINIYNIIYTCHGATVKKVCFQLNGDGHTSINRAVFAH